MAGDLCAQVDSPSLIGVSTRTTNLDLKKIGRAYAGSIIIDKDHNVKYDFWTSNLLKPIYWSIYRKFYLGWGTMGIDRDKMKNVGELFWDIADAIPEYSQGRFILYAVRTKRGNTRDVLKKLMADAENIARLKNFDSISCYPSKYRSNVMKKYGWNLNQITTGEFIKRLALSS